MVIATRFEELVVWQLAHELEEGVFAFTEKFPASRDFKFCDQIRDSARSATRNIAAGFGRYYPKEFRSFLRIAAGSLHETKKHLRDGLNRKYLPREEYDRLRRICLRAIKANNRFMAYLLTAKAPVPYAGPESAESPDSSEPREP